MNRCPPERQLQQLLDEELGDRDFRMVAGHVASCERCQVTLERLTDEGGGDEPSFALPRSRAAAVLGPPPEFLARLRVNPPVVSHRTTTAERPPELRPTPSSDPLNIPGYEILREVGRGGMGVVYQARHLGLNRVVALKMVRFGGPKEFARIRQEAEAVARLHHPNIVQIYDIGEAGDTPYLALEFVPDGSLVQYIRGDPQPVYPAARLVETLARAVHFAHQHNIVHRDLKPANILLKTHGNQASGLAIPKIADFGLAKRLDEPISLADTTELAGTPSYMAPEQAAGNRQPVGAGADVYALGAILYEMLTGRPPFKGPTPFDTLLQLVHEEPVRPGQLRPKVPRDLETICLKCLRKDPNRRYLTAADLAEDLRRFRHGSPIQARPVSARERIWKWAIRQPVHACLVFGLLLVTVIGFAGVTWQWREAAAARDVALAEKHEKEIQKEEADSARTVAEIAQHQESEQRRRARNALYYSRIAQSELLWRSNDFLSADQALQGLPGPMLGNRRGWEWYYLRDLFASQLFTLEHRAEGITGSVDVSASGRWIASVQGGHMPGETGRLADVRIWDARTGEIIHSWTVAGTFHRLAFSPDGQRLVLAGTDGSIIVRDAEAGTDILAHRPHNQAVSGVAFSPDGKRVASAGWDEVAHVWDAQTGEMQQSLRGHTGRVYHVAFHPDGRLLATAGADTTVRIWDSYTGETVRTLRGHQNAVYGVAFSPDGEWLVTAGSNGNLKIWELATGRVTQSLTGQTGAVLTVAVSPDSRYLAYAGSDTTVRVWDIDSGVERIVFRGHTAPVDGVQFTPDGQRLVSGSAGQAAVKVWDLTRHPEYSTLARTSTDIEALAFRNGERHLASVSVGGRLQIWDAASGVLQEERRLPLSEEVLTPAVLASFSPDGTRLVARGRDDGRRVARVWDASNGKEVLVLEGHRVPISCVRYSPDGQFIATGGCDTRAPGQPREIKVWDAQTGGELADLPGASPIINIAFSPDSQCLALAGDTGQLAVINWTDGRVLFQVTGHRGVVPGIAFSPNGKTLASAGLDDRAVKLWNWAVTPVPTMTLPAPTSVCDLAFSPDGRRLAGASRDLVRLWDTETGHEVLTLRGAPQRHFDPVFNPRLLWSAKGHRLVANTWDESISVWETGPHPGPDYSEQRQVARRQAADERASYWHLQEAELCLRNKKLKAARFHLQRLNGVILPQPLNDRRTGLSSQIDHEVQTGKEP